MSNDLVAALRGAARPHFAVVPTPPTRGFAKACADALDAVLALPAGPGTR